jgi:hypothetical protein
VIGAARTDDHLGAVVERELCDGKADAELPPMTTTRRSRRDWVDMANSYEGRRSFAAARPVTVDCVVLESDARCN